MPRKSGPPAFPDGIPECPPARVPGLCPERRVTVAHLEHRQLLARSARNPTPTCQRMLEQSGHRQRCLARTGRCCTVVLLLNGGSRYPQPPIARTRIEPHQQHPVRSSRGRRRRARSTWHRHIACSGQRQRALVGCLLGDLPSPPSWQSYSAGDLRAPPLPAGSDLPARRASAAPLQSLGNMRDESGLFRWSAGGAGRGRCPLVGQFAARGQ